MILKRAHFERITQKEDRMETTSLSRDIVLGRAGELELFSGFLIDMAKKYAVPVPVTKKIDEAIRQRLETVQKEKTR